MKFVVTLIVPVEADCSKAALARVLGCMNNDLGELDAEVDPDDGSLDDDCVMASASEEVAA